MSMIIHECGTTHFIMMGEGCPPSEREKSVEVFRYITSGIITIVYSCGKIRTELAEGQPELSPAHNLAGSQHAYGNQIQTNAPSAQLVARQYEQMLSGQ
jgi:hypothetical protein